jgi:hypothetical protein
VTTADVDEVEKQLGFRLPPAYRTTVLDYPFPADSFADEFMLPNRAEDVIALNKAGLVVPGIEHLFVIGSDGGEEFYLLDLDEEDPGVFAFSLETGSHRLLARSLTAYRDYVHETHAAIAADSEGTHERRLRRRWWEFWK